MSERIQSHNADGMLTLTSARVDEKNTITNAMHSALADTLSAAERDSIAHVVLLRAKDDASSAGSDIGEFASIVTAGGKGDGERNVIHFLYALAHATRPLMAAVQGRAAGTGTTMLLHCGSVLLADSAQLSTPFINPALVSEAASSPLMSARFGHACAFEILALDDAMGVESALVWGLANWVVPLYQLDTEVQVTVARLACQPLDTLTEIKRLMHDAELLRQQVDAESICLARRPQSPEVYEAFRMFADRRPSNFSALAH